MVLDGLRWLIYSDFVSFVVLLCEALCGLAHYAKHFGNCHQSHANKTEPPKPREFQAIRFAFLFGFACRYNANGDQQEKYRNDKLNATGDKIGWIHKGSDEKRLTAECGEGTQG